jgi:hypothetical protein
VAELINIVLTDQALIHPAELVRRASEFGWQDGMLVHRQYLLGGEGNLREYRVPIVAVCGWG